MLNLTTEKIQQISRADLPFGIAFNAINCIFRSSNGILWAGTNGKGLSFSHPGSERFRVYAAKKPADCKLTVESIRSIYGDQNYLFVGGYFGLDRIDKKTQEVLHGINLNVPYCMTEVKGHPDLLLVGSEGSGILILDKSLNILYASGLDGFGFYSEKEFIPFVLAYSVSHYRGDEYFIGHNSGLAVFNVATRKVVRNYVSSEDPNSIVAGEIKTILLDSGNSLWIGSTSGGLCRFDPTQEKFVRINAVNGYNPLPSQQILDIFEDHKGRLWVGTMNGLCQVSADKGLIRAYTTVDGLPNNTIVSIEECQHGNIWFGSNEGLTELNPESGEIKNYTMLHGLPDKEMNRGASYADQDGTLYFGGIEGAISFINDPDHSAFIKPFPQVIGYYEFNELKLTDTLLPYTKNITVPAGVDYFSLEVTGTDLIFDSQNSFQYRVPGIVDDWNNLDGNRRITFTNVKPGVYHVGLKVSNDLIHWVTDDSAVILTVKPKFTQTWFARIMMLLLLAGMVVLI